MSNSNTTVIKKTLDELKMTIINLATDNADQKTFINQILAVLFGDVYNKNKNLIVNKILPQFDSLKNLLDINQDGHVNLDDYKYLISQFHPIILYHLFTAIGLIAISVYDDLKSLNVTKSNISDLIFKMLIYIVLVPLIENVPEIKAFFGNTDNCGIIFKILDALFSAYSSFLTADDGLAKIQSYITAHCCNCSCCLGCTHKANADKDDLRQLAANHTAAITPVITNVILKRQLGNANAH